MPYSTTIESRDSYIFVHVSGQRQRGSEADDSLQIWKQVASLCREKNTRGLLTVLDIGGRLPASAAYQIVTTLESIGVPRQLVVALVDLNAESLQDNLFSETVALNRGYRVRVFGDEQEALQWLLEKIEL